MTDRSLLKQDPARVEVTVRGRRRWLADPPHGRADEPRWRLVDDLAGAGVWPWSEAIELAGAAHRSLQHEAARAVEVPGRFATGAEARVRALAMGLEEPASVRCLIPGAAGDGRTLVLRTGGQREWLPALEPVG